MRTPAAHPDRLTAEERRELDDNAFGIPSRREFPLVDAAHVRAAESYFRYAPEADKPTLARRILRPDSPKGIPTYYRVGENRLWRLDSHQQPITGPFADQYILTKSDSATPAGCY